MLKTESERFWFSMGLTVMGRINSFELLEENSEVGVSVKATNIERRDGRWVVKDEETDGR